MFFFSLKLSLLSYVFLSLYCKEYDIHFWKLYVRLYYPYLKSTLQSMYRKSGNCICSVLCIGVKCMTVSAVILYWSSAQIFFYMLQTPKEQSSTFKAGAPFEGRYCTPRFLMKTLIAPINFQNFSKLRTWI